MCGNCGLRVINLGSERRDLTVAVVIVTAKELLRNLAGWLYPLPDRNNNNNNGARLYARQRLGDYTGTKPELSKCTTSMAPQWTQL